MNAQEAYDILEQHLEDMGEDIALHYGRKHIDKLKDLLAYLEDLKW